MAIGFTPGNEDNTTLPADDNTAAGDTPYFVYILQCRDNTLYTGVAADVDRRLAVHNSGKGAKYTRSRLPVTAVYREECESKSAALKREAAIKKLTRDEKLKLIEKTDI